MSENFENKASSQRVVRRGIVPRLTIRVGYGTMSFFLPKTDGTVEYQPYTVKSGVSMAANLRTAFRESELYGSGEFRRGYSLQPYLHRKGT